MCGRVVDGGLGERTAGPKGIAGAVGGLYNDGGIAAAPSRRALWQAVRLLPLPFCNMLCDSLVQPLAKAVRERS